MLKKNVYLFFPPGFSGNFLNWSINKADKDYSIHTIDDPINTTDSKQLGGIGTSHLHTRIPTHQGVHMHLAWSILHKPTQPLVYCLAIHENFFVGNAIAHFAQFDKDGIFVNIHNNNDETIDMFGNINMIIKWPTYLEIVKTQGINTLNQRIDVSPLKDPHNCKDDIDFRNWLVKHYEHVLLHPNPLDYKIIQDKLDMYLKWYECRNKLQPHEVNEEQYLTPNVNLENRIYELSLLDICSEKFIPWFEKFMIDSKCSDSFELDQVKKIHTMYLAAQKNLQWFPSIYKWIYTGELDSFLTSHSGIEAMVIVKMLKKLGNLEIDWHNMDLDSINKYYLDVLSKKPELQTPIPKDFQK